MSGKNFLTGAATGVIGLGLKTVLNIVVYPYILLKLGVEQYGLYVLLLNLVDLVILMDMGLTSALVQKLSSLRALEKVDDTNQLLSIGFILYGTLAILSFVLCFFLVPMVPGFFSFSPAIATITKYCLYVILVEGALTLFQGYFSSILISHNRYQWVNTADSLYFIIANGGIFVLLHFGYGLPEMAILRLSAAVLKFALVFYHAYRHEKACIRPNYFCIRQSMDLMRVSVHAMIRTVSDIFSTRMDLVIIARVLGLKQVAMFEFVYRFLNIILQVPMHIGNAIFPIFSNLSALQNHERARQMFLRVSSAIFFLTSFLIGILYFYYHDIFNFFAGGRMAYEHTAFLVSMAIPGAISTALCLPASHYLFSAEKFKFITSSSLSTAFLKVALVLLLIKPLGLAGVVTGTLVMNAVYHQVLLIRKACSLLSISFWQYVSQVYLVSLPSLILTFALIGLLEMSGILRPLHLIVHLVLIALAFLPVGLSAWFFTTAPAEEKGMATDILKKFQTRFSPSTTPVVTLE